MWMSSAGYLASRWLAAGLLGLFSAGAVVACSDPVCDVCTSSAIIYGRVLHATGEPVTGHAVVIEAFRESCDFGERQWIWEGPVTGSDGNYRTQFRYPGPAFTACPRVIVEFPGAVPDRVTVDGPPVEFRDDFGSGGTERRDSVRVDIEVP